MIDQSDETQEIQHEVLRIFQEIDGSYNPSIKAIIFEDNPTCFGFFGDNKVKCGLLTVTGQPVSMIGALSVFQNLLTNKYQDYQNANKTSLSTLLTAAYINIQTFLPNFVVIAAEAQMIAGIIDEELTRKIDDTSNQRLLVAIFFSICLVVVSILAWYHILKQICEVFNHFKKILQILPPGIVLSSYLLKKFLNETSNHPLNF